MIIELAGMPGRERQRAHTNSRFSARCPLFKRQRRWYYSLLKDWRARYKYRLPHMCFSCLSSRKAMRCSPLTFREWLARIISEVLERTARWYYRSGYVQALIGTLPEPSDVRRVECVLQDLVAISSSSGATQICIRAHNVCRRAIINRAKSLASSNESDLPNRANAPPQLIRELFSRIDHPNSGTRSSAPV